MQNMDLDFRTSDLQCEALNLTRCRLLNVLSDGSLWVAHYTILLKLKTGSEELRTPQHYLFY